MRHVAILLVTLALALVASEVCSEYLPPEPRLVVAIGCSIQEYTAPDKYRWQHVYVWAKTPDKEWRRLFAIREVNQRAKAMADCEAWLRCIEKAIKKAKDGK